MYNFLRICLSQNKLMFISEFSKLIAHLENIISQWKKLLSGSLSTISLFFIELMKKENNQLSTIITKGISSDVRGNAEVQRKHKGKYTVS